MLLVGEKSLIKGKYADQLEEHANGSIAIYLLFTDCLCKLYIMHMLLLFNARVSVKMDTGFIAGLVFAVGFMELVNLLYVKGSLPDFLRVAAGAFPFSAFLDVLIFLLFAD